VQVPSRGGFLLFLFNHYSHATYLDHGETIYSPFFPSVVCAVAARCKLPFALRLGLSREYVERTKETTKEKTKSRNRGEAHPPPTPPLQTP